MYANTTLSKCTKQPVVYLKPISSGNIIISYMQRQVFIDGIEIALTKIDFDILYFLMNHQGWVLSFEQIYSHVWGDKESVSIKNSVGCAIKRLRKKIAGQSNNDSVIKSVWSVGYKFIG